MKQPTAARTYRSGRFDRSNGMQKVEALKDELCSSFSAKFESHGSGCHFASCMGRRNDRPM